MHFTLYSFLPFFIPSTYAVFSWHMNRKEHGVNFTMRIYVELPLGVLEIATNQLVVVKIMNLPAAVGATNLPAAVGATNLPAAVSSMSRQAKETVILQLVPGIRMDLPAKVLDCKQEVIMNLLASTIVMVRMIRIAIVDRTRIMMSILFLVIA